MSSQDAALDLAGKATFVFQGTVLKVKAANLPEVKDVDNTVVVKVTGVLQSPAMFQKSEGKEITVRLGPGQSVKAKQNAVFYTNGWIMGQKGFAVQSVGIQPAAALSRSLQTSRTPTQRLADQTLTNRLATADSVVSGRVTSISEPGALETTAKVMGATSPIPPGRISEHDPKWRDAVIEVQETHKGDPTIKKVVIRFPSSDDVRWHKAPKFSPGQQGTFILHKAVPPGEPQVGHTVSLKEAGSPEAYTALHPEDFQPVQKHDEIKAMVSNLAPARKK
ncbi:MAG TPA: hypothetical protein VJ999_12920 [Candidatus Sulfotelmatobacter sp.]|nr:hypothetical protein [Candidatus Sulfotelmatobacter sp.]